MFKTRFAAARLLLCTAVLAVAAGCSTTTSTGDARQDALNSTYEVGTKLNAAITATRGAMQSGALKGVDAQRAVMALDASYQSLRAAQQAIAATPATPASGAK